MKRFIIALALALSSGCATGGTLNVPRANEESVRAKLREQWAPFFEKEARIHEINWRLERDNTDLCGKTLYRTGAYVLTVAEYIALWKDRVWQYPLIGADHNTVQYVAEGSPAAEFGLKPGTSYAASKEPNIVAVTVCNAPAVLLRSTDVLAYTDGNHSFVSTGMVDFTKNDDELAFVLAHEMAHIVLDHIGTMKSNATKKGILGSILGTVICGLNCGISVGSAWEAAGARAHSVAFEAEADYLAAYLMARAGYDPAMVAPLWARFVEGQTPTVWGTTHPVSAERELNMSAFVNEIAERKVAGQPLFPDGWTRQP